MRLPTYKRIRLEDYTEEEQALIEKLIFPINSGFEQLYDLNNRKITFLDNIQSTLKTITIKVDSNGIPLSNKQIKLDSTNSIEGIQVINAVHATNPNTLPSGAVQIFYTQNSNFITINKITGLIANNDFTIKFITIN